MDNFKKFVAIFLLLLHSCSGNPDKVESVIEEQDLDLQMIAAYREGMNALEKGDIFYVSPLPHDSWVVGDKEYVSLHFLGAEKYAD